MSSFRIVAVGLAAMVVAACTPGANDPVIGAPPQGTVGRDLRAAQAQSALGDPNRAQQNPVATGVSVAGIERQGQGFGNVTAGAPVAVNPGTTGIERGEGVGPPPTSVARRRTPRRPATMRSTTPASTAPGTGTTTR